MSEFTQPQQTLETLNNSFAERAFKALSVVGAVLAFAGADKADAKTSVLPPAQFNNLYTSLAPSNVIDRLQNDLTAGQGMVISSADLSPSTFSAQGACEAGSVYSSWLDTPDSLQQVKCDGSGTVYTQRAASRATSTRYDAELTSIGAQLVNSIPGQSVDFNQSATQLHVAKDAVTESFVCPSPRSRQSYPNIQSVEVDQGSNARIAFCPSVKQVDMLPVDVTNPKFSGAFSRFVNDPLRTQPWGGDSSGFKYNMFIRNPQPVNNTPKVTMQFSPKRGAKASFPGLSPQQYGDKMGQFTTEVSAQLSKSGKGGFKQIGNSVLHISGLKEILVYGDPVETFPNSEVKVSDRLPGTAVTCKPSLRHATVRLRIAEHFQAMRNQQFQHGSNGSTVGGSAFKVYYGKRKQVCT